MGVDTAASENTESPTVSRVISVLEDKEWIQDRQLGS